MAIRITANAIPVVSMGPRFGALSSADKERIEYHWAELPHIGDGALSSIPRGSELHRAFNVFSGWREEEPYRTAVNLDVGSVDLGDGLVVTSFRLRCDRLGMAGF